MDLTKKVETKPATEFMTNGALVSCWCILLYADDTIPGKATLIYDVELLDIEEGHRPANFFGEIDTDGDNLLSQDEVNAIICVDLIVFDHSVRVCSIRPP